MYAFKYGHDSKKIKMYFRILFEKNQSEEYQKKCDKYFVRPHNHELYLQPVKKIYTTFV